MLGSLSHFLPLNWGIIDIARSTNATIKPINLEYVDSKCYINVGDDIKVSSSDDKKEKIEELEDAMATLKWETIEKFGIVSRDTITEKDFECYTTDRYDEYKPLNPEYEKTVPRKEYDDEREVFEHLNSIEINSNNAFLARGRNDYNDVYEERPKTR